MKNLFASLIIITFSIALSPSEPAMGQEPTTYILFNVTNDGPLITRRLVFSGQKSGNEFIAQNLQTLGRGVTNYILDPIEPGKYYLSSIYPALNERDSGSRVRIDDKDGVITIVKNSINYIGDIYVTSDETSININEIVDFTYKPNSATLMAAANGKKELFQKLDVVISIAGSKPMKVDKKLLGLEE